MPKSGPKGTSLTQDAYEQLRADLLGGRLEPGARLKITDLCRSLSVSLSAAREALARLTAEDLVVAKPQRGFRVAPISADELRDLTRVRTLIEGECLRQAIAMGSVAWEASLVAAFENLSRTPERDRVDPSRMGEAWSAAHATFHETLAAGGDSPWLLRLRAGLYAQSERYRRLSVPRAEMRRDIGAEHRAIMDATLARDAPRAVALMAMHLERTTKVLLDRSWAEPASPRRAGPRRKPPGRARPADRATKS